MLIRCQLDRHIPIRLRLVSGTLYMLSFLQAVRIVDHRTILLFPTQSDQPDDWNFQVFL